MGGLAPGQLKSRRGWHSSPRRLHYRFSFFDRVSRTHCGKNSINFAGMAHSHRHRLAAAWPSLVRQIGPVLRRRRHVFDAKKLSLDPTATKTVILFANIRNAEIMRVEPLD